MKKEQLIKKYIENKEKLETLIESNAPYTEILRQSQFLDLFINLIMKDINKNTYP